MSWKELPHQRSLHKCWRDSKNQIRKTISNVWVQLSQSWVIGKIYWLTAPTCLVRSLTCHPKSLPPILGIPLWFSCVVTKGPLLFFHIGPHDAYCFQNPLDLDPLPEYKSQGPPVTGLWAPTLCSYCPAPIWESVPLLILSLSSSCAVVCHEVSDHFCTMTCISQRPLLVSVFSPFCEKAPT